MQWLNEAAQPYLQDLVLALISLIATLIIAAMVELRKRVLTWIDSRTSNEQRELLHRMAEEAFSFAETVFKDAGRPQKLDAAYGYLSSRIKEMGITVTETEIRSIIEKAVLDYNSKVKQLQVPQ